MGHNLLTLHGLYYSTHGGWWEWAPPCNHFRMPYWQHMAEFLRASERLSYLLSQGYHRADVAILYPVAAMEAGPGGKDAVTSAFDLGTYLYGKGIDFDFMDFESLARAQVKDRELQVSGERYRVLVLPSMRTVRYSTVEKALAFHRAGGIVVALGALPEASDRIGRDDPQLDATVKEIFAGKARASTPAEVEALVNASFPRDFVCDASVQNPYVVHRKAGARDIYMVYGVPKGAQCAFRSVGSVELWDVWSGGTKPMPVLSQDGGITRLQMPLEETDAQLIVFAPGKPQITAGISAKSPERIPVQGTWEFELKPTLDNCWGDYRLPASNTFIGAEARRFRYAEANGSQTAWANPSLDDSSWQTVTESYGPHFWKLGPFPANANLSELETRLANLTSVDPSQPVEFAGTRYRWQSYAHSMRWGVEQDPGHQGYHGQKGEMPKDFIALGKPRMKSTTIVYEPEPTGVRYFLWTSAQASRPMDARLSVGGEIIPSIWINGVSRASGANSARLKGGSNPVLL